MGKGPIYNVPYRRRREGKTNYSLRKKIISSGLPRIVVRKTSKHILVQIVKPDVKGDKVVTSAHSSELRKKYGYLGSLGNLPASYLTGLFCGYRAKAKGVKESVLDIGLQIPSKGADVFGVLKGFLDAGVEVPHDERVLPDEERISGQHVAKYAKQVSSNADIYSRLFSAHVKRGLPPENIPDHFATVKKKIISDFKKPS
jgi:large subunit ribosomal protein L18